MPFPKPPAIDDTSAWLTKDPSWVDARKDAWRAVMPDLRSDPSVPRTRQSLMLAAKEVKLLETFFLTGKCRVPVHWGRHEYPSIPLLFRLWFHPDRSEANWRAQIAATIWPDYDISMEMLKRLCDGVGPGVGGLEQRMFDALLAVPPVRSFLDLGDYQRGQSVFSEASIASYRRAPNVPISTLALVLYYPDRNPNALARYALPDWLALASDPLWSKVFEDERAMHWLHHLFHLVRFKASEEGGAESAPEQIALAKELHALFDSGVGPERFQREWLEHGATDAWKVAAREPP